MAVLEGEAYWASVKTPNTTYEPCYSVNLVVPEDVAEDFKSRGFTIKRQDEGFALVIKRKVNGPKGRIRPAPRLVDAQKNELDVSVGNGSKVKVQFNEWESERNGQTFKGLDFVAMQVLELVSFGGTEDEFEIEDTEDEL